MRLHRFYWCTHGAGSSGNPTAMACFAVEPRRDCPHLDLISGLAFSAEEIFQRAHVTSEHVQGSCGACLSEVENWLCLECGLVGCSREVGGHMMDHNQQTTHAVAFSMSDASFWCYSCDSYVTSRKLELVAQYFQTIKFGDEPEEEGNHPQPSALDEQSALDWYLANRVQFTRADLLRGLAANEFKRVAVLTGAGISVAAGIPDFRTPGTGLYAQVAAAGMERPEDFFSLPFFRANPGPFYALARDFLTHQARPVQAHRFVKRLHDQGVLQYQFTQNIDGLELLTGLPTEKVVQAHGHMRSAHCIACDAPAPIEAFHAAIANQLVMRCGLCQDEANYVKPDIVFFGEGLPESFFAKAMEIDQADLVIIMGTSLRVAPFALLPQFLSPGTPTVVINRENVLHRENCLFLEGDIEDVIGDLVRDLGWSLGEPVKA